jgi:DNA-binding transcriptional MerR regulator
MPYKEKPIEKVYFSIGEVSKEMGVNASLLRYWETEFDKFIHPKKNKKGVRMYTRKDIEQIKEIYHLVKQKGFTLQGAKEHLKQGKSQVSTTSPAQDQDKAAAIQTLKRVRGFLLQLQEALDERD